MGGQLGTGGSAEGTTPAWLWEGLCRRSACLLPFLRDQCASGQGQGSIGRRPMCVIARFGVQLVAFTFCVGLLRLHLTEVWSAHPVLILALHWRTPLLAHTGTGG